MSECLTVFLLSWEARCLCGIAIMLCNRFPAPSRTKAVVLCFAIAEAVSLKICLVAGATNKRNVGLEAP